MNSLNKNDRCIVRAMHYRVTIAHENRNHSFVCEAPDETSAVRAARKALGIKLSPLRLDDFDTPATIVPLKVIKDHFHDPDVAFVLAL